MSRPLCRLMVIAAAIVSAAQSARRSPKTWPLPSPSKTMISTPRIITAMVTRVTRRGRSLRKIHESNAANIVVKARMKTRFAVEVV